MTKLKEVLELIKLSFTIVILTTLIVLVVVYTCVNLSNNQITIGNIVVAKKVIENGYSEDVVKNIIADKLKSMNSRVKTQLESKEIGFDTNESIQEISIPNSDLSVRALDKIFRSILNLELTEITGDIIPVGTDSFRISLRMQGKVVTREDKSERIIQLIENAALDAYEVTEPYIVALYHVQEKNYLKSLDVIHGMLSNKSEADDAKAWNLWGLVLMRNLHFEEALEKYNKALEVDESFFLAKVNKAALLHNDTSMADSAIASYLSVIDLDPEYAFLRIQLARLYIDKKRFDKALEQLDIAANHDPRNGDLHYVRYQLALAQTDTNNAILHLHNALLFDKQNALYNASLGALHYLRLENRKALRYIQRAYDNEPHGTTKIRYANVLYHTKLKIFPDDSISLTSQFRSDHDSLFAWFLSTAMVDALNNTKENLCVP